MDVSSHSTWTLTLIGITLACLKIPGVLTRLSYQIEP